MNYYHQRHLDNLEAAKTQIREASAHYDYPSQREIEFALLEVKKLRLRQDVNTLGKVVEHLERATGTQKSNCGCTGKSTSAGRYETKSHGGLMGRQTHHFAKHMREICREQYMDAEYVRFCEAYL